MGMRVIGARVRSLRLDRGWTQGQLAYRADVTAAQISRIEKNERPGTQAVVVGRIAEALRTSVDYLLGRTDNPSVPPSSMGDAAPAHLEDFWYVAEVLASLPDGPIRDQAVANIRAIVEDARARARREAGEAEEKEDA